MIWDKYGSDRKGEKKEELSWRSMRKCKDFGHNLILILTELGYVQEKFTYSERSFPFGQLGDLSSPASLSPVEKCEYQSQAFRLGHKCQDIV